MKRASAKAAIAIIAIACVVSVFFMSRCEKKKQLTRIGVAQITSHPALDAIRDGFVEGMEETGYVSGKNISYDFQNAQGQMSVAASIARKFVVEKVDMIVPITTPMAQAVVKATKTIPIVFGAVTDPVGAGIVRDLEHPGGNVTGVSDVWPIKDQIKLFKHILPSLRKIGVVYNPGESNSEFTMTLIRSSCNELGLELTTASVSASHEVYAASRSLVDKGVDALYTAADNTVASALESMVKVAKESKRPLFVGDSDSVERGGVATFGINYLEVGKLTAKVAVEILKGKKPSEVPIRVVTKHDFILNLKAAKEMGVEVPKELIEKAQKVKE